MSYRKPDVYYEPEHFGLTPVGETELSEPCYSFHIFAVWKDAEGQLYYGEDSGCSCPSPFEEFNSVDDLDRGTPHAVVSALNEAMLRSIEYEDSDRVKEDIRQGAAELAGKVMFR